MDGARRIEPGFRLGFRELENHRVLNIYRNTKTESGEKSDGYVLKRYIPFKAML